MRPVRALRFLIPSKLEGSEAQLTEKAGGLVDARHIFWEKMSYNPIFLSHPITLHPAAM